jgi:hypothetical protein
MSDWQEIYRDTDKRIERRQTEVIDPTLGPVWEERVTYANANEDTIRRQVATALATNTAFLAITTPTAAQNAAQVKALTRQVTALIRMQIADYREAP